LPVVVVIEATGQAAGLRAALRPPSATAQRQLLPRKKWPDRCRSSHRIHIGFKSFATPASQA